MTNANPFGAPVADETSGEELDFDKLLETSPDESDDPPWLIPKGIYTVRVIKVAPWKSPNKGTPAISWDLVIDEPGAHNGKEVNFKSWTSPQARARLRKTLAAFGITGGGPSAAVGKRAKIKLEHRTYTQDGEEKKSNDVKEVLPL